VVDAAAAGRFHVYAMTSVDEAMAVLFAAPGGEPADPADINAAVEKRIRELHAVYAAMAKDARDGR